MKPIKPNRINQQHLRALAPRAVRVVERNQANVPAVAELGRLLIPAETAYAALYDALGRKGLALAETRAQARAAVGTLRREVTTTAWLVRAYLPELDLHNFDLPTKSRDRAVAAAERLLEILTVSSVTTPSLDGLVVTLTAAVDAVRLAVEAAETAGVELQTAQAETRERGMTVYRHLCTLRRILRLALGTSHYDYQRLRTVRRHAETAEETEDEGLVNEVKQAGTVAPAVAAPVTTGPAVVVALHAPLAAA